VVEFEELQLLERADVELSMTGPGFGHWILKAADERVRALPIGRIV